MYKHKTIMVPLRAHFPQRFFRHTKIPFKNDIIVIGGGCVGQGITASFLMSNKNNRVFLIPSIGKIAKIQANGISLHGAVEKTFLPSERFIVESSLKNNTISKHNISKSPIVLIATKSHDAINSLTSIHELLRSDRKSAIICLQNGLGIENEIKTATKSLCIPILKGHVFSALHWRDDAVFSYKGRLIIQQHPMFNTILKSVFHEQDNGIFNLHLSDNILHDIYPKLAVNCVCNPLTVIFDKKLGELRANFEPLVRAMCEEVYHTAYVQGLHFESKNYLSEVVLETMSKYSEHYSSMYLDIFSGKKTEIDYINGAITRIANEKSVSAPLNNLITSAIKNIEILRLNCISSKEFYRKHSAYLGSLQTQLLSYSNINRLFFRKS